MEICLFTQLLTKRYPLRISRGASAGSTNLFVRVRHEGLEGLGEMSPFSLGDGEQTAGAALAEIENWRCDLEPLAPWEMQRAEEVMAGGSSGARAAVDFAMHDWLGRRAAAPLYRLLGVDIGRIPATSVTVGINPPEVVRERIPILLADGARILKIKLGSPEGLDADRAMFEAVRESTPPGVPLRVDANGGWTVDGAQTMMRWLADRDVEYVEQPLPPGQDHELPRLYADSPLPVYADESCRMAADVPRLADRVHGINLKLMKAGGIREGLRVIHAARAHGLRIMMGCMSESSLAIAASAHLSPLADSLDLDSHLNLAPDPCSGLRWEGGRVLPGSAPGLGVSLAEEAGCRA